jgi:hypothetical protein
MRLTSGLLSGLPGMIARPNLMRRVGEFGVIEAQSRLA